MPTVTTTVPTKAPVTVRMPPATSMASTSTATSSVYCFGFVLPTAWTRSAPASPTTATLITQAVQRGQNRSIPMAPAAISSSRVATANRPDLVSRNTVATRMAASAATQSQVLVSILGTPESPPAPRVSSVQFFTTWSTTKSTASVIIVAARPPARATATPTMAPTAVATMTPTIVPPTAPSSTSPSPNGRSGRLVALLAAGIVTRAAPYAAIWAKARWPNDKMPVDPMNTCSPMTMTRLTSSSWISRSRAVSPVAV